MWIDCTIILVCLCIHVLFQAMVLVVLFICAFGFTFYMLLSDKVHFDSGKCTSEWVASVAFPPTFFSVPPCFIFHHDGFIEIFEFHACQELWSILASYLCNVLLDKLLPLEISLSIALLSV